MFIELRGCFCHNDCLCHYLLYFGVRVVVGKSKTGNVLTDLFLGFNTRPHQLC